MSETVLVAAAKGLPMTLDVRVLMIEGDGSSETEPFGVLLPARFFFGVSRGLSEAAAVEAAAAALARNAAAPDSSFDDLSGVRDPLLPPGLGLGCLVCAGAAAFAGVGRVGAEFFRRAGLLAFARAAAAAWADI